MLAIKLLKKELAILLEKCLKCHFTPECYYKKWICIILLADKLNSGYLK